MKIKKKYLSLIILLFPLLITIGFASWVIIYTIEFQTEYKRQPVSELYGITQSTTFNDEEQVPIPLNDISLESLGISEDEIEYSYKLTKDKNFISNSKPIDAGEYDVRIKIEGSDNGTYDGVCQVKFTIKKRKIKLKNNIININYGELGTSDQWTELYNILLYDSSNNGERAIKFVDENGVEDSILTTTSYKFTSMNNGVYFYDDEVDDLSSVKIVGSTYVATINLNELYSNNYEFINSNGVAGNKLIIKYKTAKIGSTYYTIEEAINSGSSIIYLAGDSSSASSYVETCFTKISLSDGNPYGRYDFTISSASTLVVPYTDSTSGKEIASATSQTSSKVYSNLIIPDGITLNVYGNLTVAAKICYSQPGASITLDRGVLYNDGVLNCFSGSILKSYGYIKGDGVINLENGSAATEVLRIYDFPGGSATMNIMSKIFPINTWSLNNIGCNTYIKNGARLYGYAYLSVTGLTVDNQYLLVGKSNDSNCIFKSSGTATNYILKVSKSAVLSKTGYDPNSLYDVTGHNQMIGNRSEFIISGNYSDAVFKLEVNALASFSTGTSKSLPIGFIDITLKSGSTLELVSSDYVFLPGTFVKIENGATATIGSNIDISFATVDQVKSGSNNSTTNYAFMTNCVDQIDSKFIVNGQLIVKGNLGGKIQSENLGAVINYTNTAATATSTFSSLYTTASPYYYTVSNYQATGRIDSVDNANFAQGKYYIYTEVNSQNTWKIETNVTTFTINFYDNDKTTLLKTISIGVASDTYNFTGDDYTPSKLYYDFAYWLDWDGNQIPEEGKNYNSDVINVYAEWTEIEYSFNYSYFIENEDGTFTQIYNEGENKDNNLSLSVPENYKFTISSFTNNSLTIQATATYLNKYFYGWYLYNGIEFNEDYRIDFTLSFENFENIVLTLKENGFSETSIPICCKFTDYQTYTVKINPGISGETEITYSGVIPSDSITFTDYSSYSDTDTSKSVYFICWSVYSQDTEKKYGLSLTVSVQNILDQIENCNNDTPDSIIIENNVLYVYGVVQQKCSVIYKELNYLGSYIDGSLKSDTFWYLPGYKFDYSVYYNKSCSSYSTENYFIEEQSTGGIIDLENHTVLIQDTDVQEGVEVHFCYYKKLTVTIGTCEKATVTASIDTQSPVREGTYVTFKITYTGDEDRNCKVTIDGVTNTYSSSSNEQEIEIMISGNTTVTASSSCIPSGTLITLADGSKKKVEDLTLDDMLLVFNHETGMFEAAPIVFIDCDPWTEYNIVNLVFSDGTITRLIYEHGYFNLTLNKYVYVTEANYREYIGHDFVIVDGNNISTVTLVDSYVTYEYSGCYSPVTAYHMNYIVDGMLSMPGGIEGIFNIFEYGEGLKYDEKLMNADIDKYGLMSYEELSDYVPYEMYCAFPAKYFNVAIGKGMITYDEILAYIDKYLGRHDLNKKEE